MNLDEAESAKAEVKYVLAQSPQDYGFDSVRWSLEQIRDSIGWLRGKTIPGTWQILQRLGFSYQKAAAFVRSPDPFFRLKVRKMMQVFQHAIYHPDQAVVLFQDELSYYLTPSLAPDWGETGAPPRVDKAPGDALTRIGAVLDGYTGSLLYLQGGKFGIKQMRTLYQQIRSHYHQPHIYVVQDNCPSVHKHQSVLDTAEALGITPVFLPTYASWLNPIERLWRLLKADILHNHPWSHCLSRLRTEVCDFLDQFLDPSDYLLKYVGLLPD